MSYDIYRKMKKELILRGILIVAIVAVSLSLIIAATLSWYRGTLEVEQDFVIEADGVLYLYAPASVEDLEQTLSPAKAMPWAVANNLHMDVLKEYDELDPHPSYVSRAATVGSHSSYFIFYNEHRRNVQAVDEYGNPIFDEYGNPVYVQVTDEQGNPIFDDEGNPIYITEPTPATLTYELSIKKTPDAQKQDYIDIEQIVIKEFYFSYDQDPIASDIPIDPENGALDYLHQSQDKLTGSVKVEGTVEVYIHMQIYLANVDELMDPIFSNSDFYLEIKLAVMPEAS